MKLSVGTKVKMNRKMAQWYLEHPEIFDRPGGNTAEDEQLFDRVMKIAILVCLDGDVTGKITRYGTEWNCYRVIYKGPFGNYGACYNRNHFDVLHGVFGSTGV